MKFWSEDKRDVGGRMEGERGGVRQLSVANSFKNERPSGSWYTSFVQMKAQQSILRLSPIEVFPFTARASSISLCFRCSVDVVLVYGRQKDEGVAVMFCRYDRSGMEGSWMAEETSPVENDMKPSMWMSPQPGMRMKQWIKEPNEGRNDERGDMRVEILSDLITRILPRLPKSNYCHKIYSKYEVQQDFYLSGCRAFSVVLKCSCLHRIHRRRRHELFDVNIAYLDDGLNSVYYSCSSSLKPQLMVNLTEASFLTINLPPRKTATLIQCTNKTLRAVKIQKLNG
ncbi:hypothetical protein FB446DRAFT_706138 [Lentinula raphanica]|nr:hypothetical protein FB446DRAFT_706138 [Lentinula raphanica]